MSMCYKNGTAKENLQNYSVCVKENDGIRRIHHKNDLQDNLVLVNNIAPYSVGADLYVIKEGDYIRYVDVTVVPKMIF